MISTHFDLQNIIKEMESTGNGAESSVNATGSEFSATITRVLESLPHDIESETELVDYRLRLSLRKAKLKDKGSKRTLF